MKTQTEIEEIVLRGFPKDMPEPVTYSLLKAKVQEAIKLTIFALQSNQKDVLKLLKFNCIYRIRGIEIDIKNQENKEFFKGMNGAYQELLRKLTDIKSLISAVNEKYLDDNEKKDFEELKNKIEQKFKCANCDEEPVEHEGDFCDNCNLPERSVIQ